MRPRNLTIRAPRGDFRFSQYTLCKSRCLTHSAELPPKLPHMRPAPLLHCISPLGRSNRGNPSSRVLRAPECLVFPLLGSRGEPTFSPARFARRFELHSALLGGREGCPFLRRGTAAFQIPSPRPFPCIQRTCQPLTRSVKSQSLQGSRSESLRV